MATPKARSRASSTRYGRPSRRVAYATPLRTRAQQDEGGDNAMSITTYAELQSAIGNWLDHSLFAARIPEFIALFEACANRRLRVRQQEATINLTPDAEGATLKVRPLDQTALEINYFQKIPPLATTDPNWLLTAHPDLYLFGSLVEAEMFGVNDERAPLWKARRDEIFDEIDKLNNKTRGGDPGAARVMGT